YAVVNPAQRVATIDLPRLAPAPDATGGRVLFRDAGFVPAIERDTVRLGPGQLALVGTGRYAGEDDGLGIEQDVQIPRRIAPLPARFVAIADARAVEATIAAPASGDLRIVLEQ